MACNEGSSINVEKKKLRTLAVEDNPCMRLFLKTLLSNKFGIEARVVGDGKEAVDLFDAGHRFELVFMDMEMPVMDGIQAVKELRARGVQSFIIGNSASTTRLKIEEFRKSGLDTFMKKPIDKDELALVIQHLT